MEKNNNNKIPSGPWWKDGAMVFSEISTWIVGPIVLALILGKYLDEKYGTEPWMFLGLAVLGFVITAYGIIKSVRKYADKQKKIDRQEDIAKQKKLGK
ncbi:MAG TPA: AtpZ/AtpI family protein [Candidatus Paceibacterota bacterium]|nr:AtpZ/AtpI family protein [Candidatus Paceibacterota bacterium]